MLQHVAASAATFSGAAVGREASVRVHQAEAARQLGVNRSSLSRYLKEYESLVDSDGKVDVDEIRAHRDANLRVPETSARPAAAKRSDSTATRTRHSESKARRAELEVERLELELAKEAGELVEAAAIVEPVIEATGLMRDKLLMPEISLGERLAAERDPTVCCSLVAEYNRAQLDECVKALEASKKTAERKDDEPASG